MRGNKVTRQTTLELEDLGMLCVVEQKLKYKKTFELVSYICCLMNIKRQTQS